MVVSRNSTEVKDANGAENALKSAPDSRAGWITRPQILEICASRRLGRSVRARPMPTPVATWHEPRFLLTGQAGARAPCCIAEVQAVHLSARASPPSRPVMNCRAASAASRLPASGRPDPPLRAGQQDRRAPAAPARQDRPASARDCHRSRASCPQGSAGWG